MGIIMKLVFSIMISLVRLSVFRYVFMVDETKPCMMLFPFELSYFVNHGRIHYLYLFCCSS